MSAGQKLKTDFKKWHFVTVFALMEIDARDWIKEQHQIRKARLIIIGSYHKGNDSCLFFFTW